MLSMALLSWRNSSARPSRSTCIRVSPRTQRYRSLPRWSDHPPHDGDPPQRRAEPPAQKGRACEDERRLDPTRERRLQQRPLEPAHAEVVEEVDAVGVVPEAVRKPVPILGKTGEQRETRERSGGAREHESEV